MTPNDQDPGMIRAPGDHAGERVLDYNRLQLSAFLDGELPADEAKFLLRRLQHDDELRGCWERWQFSGAVMRGQVGRCVEGGFPGRVAAAIAAEATVPRSGAGTTRWLRWGGGAALAASVAVFALFLTRQATELRPAAVSQPRIADARPAPAQRAPGQRLPAPAVTTPLPSAPDHGPQLATALAVADAPRRLVERRSRGQSQRAALRSASRVTNEMPVAIAATAAPFTNAVAPIDPFSGQHVRLPNRPWPRALLPGAVNGDAFNVDYGSRSGTGLGVAHPLSPFAPPVQPAPNGDTATDLPPPQ